MTTIAYNHKDRQISVDSRSTIGGVIACDCEIKWIERDDGLYFIAGTPCDIGMFFDYVDGNGGNHPEYTPDCTALHIDKNGDCYIVAVTDAGQTKRSIVKHNHAIGSGDTWAISATDFGRSSAEAVAYASTKCVYTGGKVHTYDIASKQFIQG